MAGDNSNFIPNIDVLVAKKIKELGLKPLSPLEKFKKKKKRFYSTRCLTKSNKKIFLKILISKEKPPALWLKREALFTEFISAFVKTEPSFKIPVYLNSQTKTKPFWLQHQYLPGNLVGYHFKIYKKGLFKVVRNKIVDNLSALQAVSSPKNKKIVKKMGVAERTYEEYLKTIKKFEKKINKSNPKRINFEEIYKFFDKRKKYFNKKEFVLAHGDFTLANFFINRGNVYLTDWEQVHLDNFASDIARMWIQTFEYPKWRRELVIYFMSKMPESQQIKFKESFSAITIKEALVEFACAADDRKEEKIKKIQEKTLSAALKGFDCLINLQKI